MADLYTLFRYDDWANRETATFIVKASAPPEPALSRMAHIIAAEFLWYSRITGIPGTMPVWPQPQADKFLQQLDALQAIWFKLLEESVSGGLDRAVSYTNSKGEQYHSRLEDVLTHVVFHSAYHRGQIASDMRAAGFEPAYTDYIHAVRTGKLG